MSPLFVHKMLTLALLVGMWMPAADVCSQITSLQKFFQMEMFSNFQLLFLATLQVMLVGAVEPKKLRSRF